jgi:hypothetical protein
MSRPRECSVNGRAIACGKDSMSWQQLDLPR